jgi:hypothetical protein
VLLSFSSLAFAPCIGADAGIANPSGEGDLSGGNDEGPSSVRDAELPGQLRSGV